MKKFIITTCFFLSIFLFDSCEAWCQGISQDCIFLLGFGESEISGPESGSSWNCTIGAIAGVEKKIRKINENSSINAGINFTLQGAGYEEYEFSGRVRLSYIYVPFFYTYESNSGIYGEIGLQPGFLLFARDKSDGMDGYNYNESYRENMRGFELGLPVGVGYNVNNELSVGVRGIYGILNNDNIQGSTDKDHNFMVLAILHYNINSLIGKNKDKK